jgi:formimidoylglutamate deiminase
VAWLPDLIYVGGRFQGGLALVSDTAGRVESIVPADEVKAEAGGVRVVRLAGRALLPGLVNAHSHAFQRVIRGRTEHRSPASNDSFWTWREQMYAASSRLTPEDLYDASRMAFLEMALSGVTAVGEFHYLHRTPAGEEYDDPNLLARQVCAAARDVGLRIALLRVTYARAGFRKPPDERQRRFIEPDPATFIKNTDALRRDLARGEAERGDESGRGGVPSLAWAGVAPHSVRAVPLDYLREAAAYAAAERLPVHMHVAEQPAEVLACVEETGLTPVALLGENGILGARFTAVHAVHVTAEELDAMAVARAGVCACPTTERNLGDGVVPADEMFARGVSVCLGSDSHAQIDLLEDARALEYHLRLSKLARNVLAPAAPDVRAGDAALRSNVSSLAARLFDCASANGAQSLGLDAGTLAPGTAADFFTVSLDDPSIAGTGTDDLLPSIVFSLARTALRETVVGGRLVVEGGRHAAQDETVARFTALQRKLWG